MSLRRAHPPLMRVAPVLAWAVIRILHRLMRWRLVNDGVVRRLNEEGRSYVHAIFHDQLMMMTYSYLGGEHGRTLAVLTSRHRDGEYLARTLERFGHLMVRGSTGGGAVAGLKEMIRHMRAGKDAGWATDGPRGPRHRVQIGVIEAARLGRAPIVPVAFGVSRKKTLRSWDAFQVPLPFARGVFVYGEPMAVPETAGREEMERVRVALEETLERLTGEAEALARDGWR